MNGTPNYHQNVNTNTFEANRNSCETNKNVPKPEHQQSRTRNKKQSFVGNLSDDLNVKYLKELFGLATWYLIGNCSITMPINRKTEKNKGIVFILSSGQVHNEFLKINPLSANPTKWSNKLKQFVGNFPKNCLSVFDHFVKLALKGLMTLNSMDKL